MIHRTSRVAFVTVFVTLAWLPLAARQAPATTPQSVDLQQTLPFDAAVKTGTSSDFRDNWAVGWANDIVVAVWAGRPDGSSMLGVSGVTGAGPVLRRVLSVAAGRGAKPWPSPPEGVVYAKQAGLVDLMIQTPLLAQAN